MTLPQISFPALLQNFFQQRLVAQRGASAQTVASYRDTFELLLRYAEKVTRRSPSALVLDDLDAPLVLAFLDYLETQRGNCPRTRNLRLTAIRSFMRYASLREPTALSVAQRVLAIPSKRFDRPALEFLSRQEIKALLDAPDRSTWSGQRDTVLLATLYNTGARVSEITALRVADVLTDRDSALHLHGKGRKERVVPLWKSTAAQLRAWIASIDPSPSSPVFPNRTGQAPVALWCRTPAGRRAGHRLRTLPLAGGATDLAPHDTPHHGDAPTSVRRGHHRHRPVARPRGSRHYSPLCGG